MKEILFDTLLDSVKILPFLFLTYLVMELLEHKTGGKSKDQIRRARWSGPIWGGLLGVIIAMAAVIIIYLTNDTIKVEEDVERYLGLSVLGSIPFSEKESRSKKKKSRKRR